MNTGFVEPEPYTNKDELIDVFANPLILVLPLTSNLYPDSAGCVVDPDPGNSKFPFVVNLPK